jgi:hypothetical protein
MDMVKTYKNSELLNEDFILAKLPPIRSEFIAKLENSLMFLNYKDLNMWHSEAKNKVHLKNFDGSWLIDISLKHKENEGFCFNPFDKELQVTPDIFPNMNIKTLNLSGDIAQMTKHRFLNQKEKRHLENYRYLFSQKMAFLDYGKQKWWTDENGFGFNKINRTDNSTIMLPMPCSLKPGYIVDKLAVSKIVKQSLEDKDSAYIHAIKNFHMALQLSLTYYYEWSCYICEDDNSLGVRIPIHPSSSKDVFVMRNIPEGTKRKKAIVNFVKDHYRTITDFRGEEREILIKKHFRGELKFNWRGLKVSIIPSEYDLNRIKTKKKFKKF